MTISSENQPSTWTVVLLAMQPGQLRLLLGDLLKSLPKAEILFLLARPGCIGQRIAGRIPRCLRDVIESLTKAHTARPRPVSCAFRENRTPWIAIVDIVPQTY